MDTTHKDEMYLMSKIRKHQMSYHLIPHCSIHLPFSKFARVLLAFRMPLPSGIGSDVKPGCCYLYAPDPLVKNQPWNTFHQEIFPTK